MAHYVISDLHGELDKLERLLEMIHFSEQDTLYILGDCVDRGPYGIEIIRMAMQQKNWVMLLGNHELMCLQYHAPGATLRDAFRWGRNRNTPTLEGLARLSAQEKQEVLDYMHQLPTHLRITVDGRDFYLVHGFPGENVHDEVWQRPEPDTPNPIAGCQLILGHTPVTYIGRGDDGETDYVAELAKRGEHVKILHAPGFIDLDCCCGYDIPVKALACLRLEDMEEFYVTD